MIVSSWCPLTRDNVLMRTPSAKKARISSNASNGVRRSKIIVPLVSVNVVSQVRTGNVGCHFWCDHISLCSVLIVAFEVCHDLRSLHLHKNHLRSKVDLFSSPGAVFFVVYTTF